MKKLKDKHPEVATFDQDRMILSTSVAQYIKDFRLRFPQVSLHLDEINQIFAGIDNLSSAPVALNSCEGWTHTEAQRTFAFQQINRMLERYPVPQALKKELKPGLYLDLRSESDDEEFANALQVFAQKVEKLSSPRPLKFTVNTMGNIPLQEIYDPLLNSRVTQLWTLDISYNPGVSIKDIMARYMIDDALASGALTNKQIIVEGTSGNTGAGLAIVAAAYGMKIILVIPDKMSQEKIDRLRALGAHVVVTPTKVAATDPKSYYSVRDYLAELTKGWSAQQYDNIANRQAHFDVTGPLIWEKTNGEVTAVIATAGTCGTISGVGRYLKSKNRKIKMIAVDTIGSILYLLKAGYDIKQVEEYARGYMIQGFGEDIHPLNLDLAVIDHFVRVGDKTGLQLTRYLPSLGFFAGQSSGAAYAALIESLSQNILGVDDKVVVLFPDIGLPYRKDVYSDDWMQTNKFI